MSGFFSLSCWLPSVLQVDCRRVQTSMPKNAHHAYLAQKDDKPFHPQCLHSLQMPQGIAQDNHVRFQMCTISAHACMHFLLPALPLLDWSACPRWTPGCFYLNELQKASLKKLGFGYACFAYNVTPSACLGLLDCFWRQSCENLQAHVHNANSAPPGLYEHPSPSDACTQFSQFMACSGASSGAYTNSFLCMVHIFFHIEKCCMHAPKSQQKYV